LLVRCWCRSPVIRRCGVATACPPGWPPQEPGPLSADPHGGLGPNLVSLVLLVPLTPLVDLRDLGSPAPYARDVVDHLDPTPLYEQLAAVLAGQIERGELAPRQPLPSEAELAREHGVARRTVRRALELLRERGLVVSIERRGTYVAEK
jgi:GntR family transcriptional regulator